MNDVKVCVFGHLGKDPEMHYMPSGKAVTNFNVAATRKWTVNDQEFAETTWFRVSTFDKIAGNCHTYLHKGSFVYFEGRLNVDPKTGGPKIWSRQDNSAGANFEVSVNEIRFLTPKGTNGSNESDAIGSGEPEFDTTGNTSSVPVSAGANTDSDGFPL